MIDIIVISGPTASGKTGVSIELSKLMNIEIISADSRQVYKYLDIGTAKVTTEERAAVRHHYIDFLMPDEYYSSGVFGDDAYQTVQEIHSRGAVPVVVGGSGLYVKALCEGLFEEEFDANRLAIREQIEAEAAEHGIEFLYQTLKETDPMSAELYKDMNPRRIIRALEYYRSTGNVFSEAHKTFAKQRDLNPSYFGIDYPRQKLYERINLRSELMWKNGIVEETEKVLAMGYSPALNSLNTVGYKEAIAYLKGEMSSNDALEKLKQNTRRYAKRQLTWFRRYDEMKWIAGSEKDIAQHIYSNFIG